MMLDTNALSALLAGDTQIARVLAGVQRVAIPVVVLGEYRYGLKRSAKADDIGRSLDLLELVSDLLPVTQITARIYAEVREALRKKGTPIPENDLWIAALALQTGMPLLTRDRHFAFVVGLVCRGW